MRLILLRHGQTSWNLERRIQGQRDIPLNETGKLQMHRITEHFASRKIHFNRILTSPLLRAKQSAEICSKRLNVQVEEVAAFRERSFGLWEGVTIEEIAKHYGIDCEELIDSQYEVESQTDVITRVKQGFYDLTKRFANQDILLITHGSIIKLFAKQFGVDVGIMSNATYLELHRYEERLQLFFNGKKMEIACDK